MNPVIPLAGRPATLGQPRQTRAGRWLQQAKFVTPLLLAIGTALCATDALAQTPVDAVIPPRPTSVAAQKAAAPEAAVSSAADAENTARSGAVMLLPPLLPPPLVAPSPVPTPIVPSPIAPVPVALAPRVAGPRELPAPIARLAGVERLAQALARYGDVDTPIERSDWRSGVLSHTCDAPKAGDAQWRGINKVGVEGNLGATQYLGEHENCFPRGLGRASSEVRKGLQVSDGPWVIGELRPARIRDCGLLGGCTIKETVRTAEPAGLVEVRWASGLREFLQVEMGDPPKTREEGFANPEADSTVIRMLGTALPDGTVVVHDQRGRWRGRYAIGREELPGVLHRPDGWTATAKFKAGQFAGGEVVWRAPDGAMTIGVRPDTAGSDALVRNHWLRIRLEEPLNQLPPGLYRLAARGMKWKDAPQWVRTRWLDMMPAAAETLKAAAAPRADCWHRPDLVPDGWVVWWPACREIDPRVAARAGIPEGLQLVQVWSPDATHVLHLSINPDGKVTQRTLEFINPDYADGGPRGVGTSWTAPGLAFEGGAFRIDGEGQFREFNYDGTLLELYNGPFAALKPHGRGRCGKPGSEGGGTEPCSYSMGRRSDELDRARRERRAAAAERERQRERERDERQRAQARREAEEEERQEQRLLAERRRQADAESADFHSTMMGAIGGLKQSFDKGAADLTASNRATQAAIAQANEAARQRQRQQDAGPPPGTLDPAKEARDQRAYQQQRDQQRADLAADRRQQTQQSNQQASTLQAQRNAAQRQSSGSYISPYETGRPAVVASVSGSPVPTECLKETQRRFGGHCNKAESVTVFVQNVCQTPINIRICIDTPQGETCETNLARPGATVSMWECQLSGGVRFSGSNPR